MNPKSPLSMAKEVQVVAKDPALQTGALKRVGGSQSDDWNNLLTNDTLKAMGVNNADDENRSKQVNAAVAGLIGIAPQDELEGMMAAQLIAAHSATMECYRRAIRDGQTVEGRSENLSQANKLSRTFAVLVDALNRHRGKGQQRVTVEHVHVHAGGQAIVGAIQPPGGGVRPKLEEQPHAKQIAYAPEPPMRSPDSVPEAVPVAGHGERPLQDARRPVSRSTGRKPKRL